MFFLKTDFCCPFRPHDLSPFGRNGFYCLQSSWASKSKHAAVLTTQHLQNQTQSLSNLGRLRHTTFQDNPIFGSCFMDLNGVFNTFPNGWSTYPRLPPKKSGPNKGLIKGNQWLYNLIILSIRPGYFPG